MHDRRWASTLIAEAPATSVRIEGDTVFLDDVQVEDERTARYLRDLPAADRERAVAQALKLGILCLERVGTHADVDYLRKETQTMVGEVQKVVGDFGAALLKQVGTGDGQVLAPVKLQIDLAQKTLHERLDGVKKLLSDEMDPAKGTSTLGKALKTVHDLVDPKRTDSIQGALTAAIEAATGEKGKLAMTVKEAVAEAVKPLAERVDALAKEVLKEEATDQATQDLIENTTLKGAVLEDEVVAQLANLQMALGMEVEHVGTDNQPGDVLVSIKSETAAGKKDAIIIECRDTAHKATRKPIVDDLEKRMDYRKANAAIYLCRDVSGFGREIGEWAEGVSQFGPWVATTQQHLLVAIRYLRVQLRLEGMKATEPKVDVPAAQGQIAAIRDAMRKVGNINRSVGQIKATADEVAGTADALRADVLAALLNLEDKLRVRPDATLPPPPARPEGLRRTTLPIE
jgi:hypothetical protein